MSKNREPSWVLALRLTASDLTGHEAAKAAGIHYSVFCRNLKRAREKLGCKTTAAAIYKAAKSGLIIWTFAVLPVNDSFAHDVLANGAVGSEDAVISIVRLRNGRTRTRSGRNSRRLD